MTAEHHRHLAMKAVASIKTWQDCWPVWEGALSNLSDNFSDAIKVHQLGDHLREVFFATNTGARDQGSLSGGGAGWESLVTWYLNLVFSGTNAVAMRQSQAVVPRTLLDATTIRYGNHQTNTESDVCVVVYPENFNFPVLDKDFMKNLDAEVAKRIGDIELGIIQCKTNWNDNAQVPMLWDMVYRASFGPGTGIHIGKNGYSVKNLQRFTYSFVTVPSQKEGRMPSKSTQMAVKRVANLTGGNYWGLPTKSGVALSLSEIFDSNFASAFGLNVRASIQQSIDAQIGLFGP
ncbi:hypothetical protein [Thalassobius sp. Cn5-15]|uniref:hypothetical protein n=1 Tax=Thalassobius sp. Cn5-15 TaxID=2917763 RepID=UPI001EF17112|nr:hypothetical protein [Thalassobius sp. Cn5-15]MCG7493895.1 hypothetical protein [Thalassobius sp. Cn5-15]